MKSRLLLGLTLLSLPLLGFTQQTNSTKVCVIEKQTTMGKVICFVPCNTKGGGK